MSNKATMALVSLLAFAASQTAVGCSRGNRTQDVAERRQALAVFAPYPGSTLERERSYEIKAGDSEGTGHYTVAVQYKLPRETTSHDVMEFFKHHVPPGWRAATDEDCVTPALPPGRSAQLPSGALVLTSTRIIATFFAPKPGKGVTISLRGSGDNKLLFMDQEILSCGPPGPNPLDKLADDFDR